MRVKWDEPNADYFMFIYSVVNCKSNQDQACNVLVHVPSLPLRKVETFVTSQGERVLRTELTLMVSLWSFKVTPSILKFDEQ